MNGHRTLVLREKIIMYIYKGLIKDVTEPISENQYCVLFRQDSQQETVFLPSFKLMLTIKRKKKVNVGIFLGSGKWNLTRIEGACSR